MKEIALSQGKVALVDDQDYDWLLQWKWHFDGGYAKRKGKRQGSSRKTIAMHAELFGASCDHRNRNGLDNRRSNLRVADKCQQMQNRKCRKTKSGFKGLHWYPQLNKWGASIKYRMKNTYLGVFESKEEAAMAYDKAALKLHGEFAALNFPLPITAPAAGESPDAYR